MRHAAAKIGYSTHGVKRLHIVQVAVCTPGIDSSLVAYTYLSANHREVNINRTIGHATVAHHTVLGKRFGIFLQFQIANGLKHINALHIDNAQFAVHRATVDTDAAT